MSQQILSLISLFKIFIRNIFRFSELGRILSDQSEMLVNVDRAVESQTRDENGTCCLPSKSGKHTVIRHGGRISNKR